MRQAIILSPLSFLAMIALSIHTSRAGDFPEAFLPGWQGDKVQECRTPKELFAYMDGGAELYLEYHFRKLSVQEYHHPKWGDLTAEIWRFGRSEDAYGIFSLDTTGIDHDRGQGGRGPDSSQSGAVRFWKGAAFVRVFAWQEHPEARVAVDSLARQIEANLPDTAQPAPWLTALIRQKLRPVFVRGPIALQQAAGALPPADVPINRATGAAWIRPQELTNGLPCLILPFDAESKATTAFHQLWKQLGAPAESSVLAGQRGLIRRPDHTVEGIEQVGANVIWVIKANDESACTEALDKIKIALMGK